MDSDITIKTEPVDVEYSEIQVKVEINPLDNDEDSMKIKSEPVDSESSSDLNTHQQHQEDVVDHQPKEEIVIEINPVELHKDSEDVHPDFLFVCNICSKIFEDKFTLTEHLEEHSIPSTSKKKKKLDDKDIEKQNVKSFSILCYAGKKEPSKKEVVENNEEEIDNVEKVENKTNNETDSNPDNKCRICYKTFTRRNNLQRHIKQFHVSRNNKVYSADKFIKTNCLVGQNEDGEQEMFPCECGIKFFNKWSIAWHKKSYCKLKKSKSGT